MQAELFDYALPPERIAQRPTAARDGARLLVLGANGVEHRFVRELPELLPTGSLIVVNDTRVRRARVFGARRPGGGRVELFFLDFVANAPDGRAIWQALGRANKPLRRGTVIDAPPLEAEVTGELDGGVLELAVRCPEPVDQVLERIGHVPIPPYLGRSDEPEDSHRYQTVFARRTASVAAPTAGLHLTHELLDRVRQADRRVATLELEVGIGTFRPVSVPDLDHHPMHSEKFHVSPGLAAEIRATRERGGKVVAIGTTVVRALESAADPDHPGQVRPVSGETRLLIQPGYCFKVVDALFTNFHQPRSTLLALVSAFAGRDRVLSAYAAALAAEYRFLSYGDAMWIPDRLDQAGAAVTGSPP